MAEPRALQLVQQWLDESGYRETLDCLQRESNRPYDPLALPLSGELSAMVSSLAAATDHSASPRAPSVSPCVEDPADRELVSAKGDGRWACLPAAVLTCAHKTNVLCVRLLGGAHLVASGSSDRTVAVTDWRAQSTTAHVPLDSPPLALDWLWKAGDDVALLLAATMSGDVHVLSVGARDGSLLGHEKREGAHEKYAICARWVSEGAEDGFVTASNDGSVVLSRRDEATGRWAEVRSWHFPGAVEALTPFGAGSFAVSVRGDNCLRRVTTEEQEPQELLNMNATGDDHVSFAALDLRESPAHPDRHVMIYTDRGRIIVCNEEGRQLRNLYGLGDDPYARPKCCWDSTGGYVYTTSAEAGEDTDIMVWEVATQRRVAKLKGHTKALRSLDFSQADGGVLATGSFDASIRIWTKPPQ